MIRLNVVDDEKQHFILNFEEPGRVEISVIKGRVVAHVYKGAEDDTEQDPSLMYDGHLGCNKSAEVP